MPQTIQGGTNVGTSGNDDLRTLYYDSATETTTIYSALSGLGGNDRLDNNGLVESVTMDGGLGNDRISNTVNGGDNSKLIGGSGNDNIQNGSSTVQLNNATIDGGADSDTIQNYGDNASISAADGDDSIYGVGDKATITGGNDNDSISNYGDDSSIDGGNGNDWLEDWGSNVTVSGGTGNDTLRGGGGNEQSRVSNVLFEDTIGNNRFSLFYTTNGTINAGTGDDTVYNDSSYNKKILINVGAGNNSVYAWYDSDVTIQAQNGNDSLYLQDSSNMSIDAGDGANNIDIDNLNASTLSGYTINAGTGNDTVHVYRGHRALISTGGGDDSINNVGHNSTINGGDGDDWINNHGGGRDYDVNSTMSSNNLIDGGAGNDSITNGCDNVTINGGDNDDYISSAGVDKVLINGGDGNDTIENIGNINREVSTNSTLNGGAGDDYIYNLGNKVTITAGTGNDTVLLATGRDVAKQDTGSENVLINYSSGDGNDLIKFFNATSTLSIGGGNYSSAVSGNDVILTVGNGKITLSEAATLDTLNIVGTLSGGDTTSGGDVEVATSLVGAMLYRTEAGYPVIAGIAFHPEEYHGGEPTNYASKETWTIESSDGLELEGYHYTPENSNDKWVVIIHGYGHNHKHMYPFAGFYLDNGYNVLMVDQRAAGDSEGNWLTMGNAESADIALWTQEIARRNSDAKITLFGVSMGAATAMLAASRSDITNVTSLVEDCGYSNVVDIINLFNNLIFQEDQETIDLMQPISESLTGYNLKDAAPIDYISNAKMPTLFITGSEDSVVAGSMLPALYNASGATVKEQFIVEGAGHGVAGLYDPVGYSNTTFRFLAEANGEGWVTENAVDDISLRGTKYNDSINNSGDNVTIDTAAGNDTVENSGRLVTINAGDGNDYIVNDIDSSVTAASAVANLIDAGAGNDTIYNHHSYQPTLLGGDGKDSIVVNKGHMIFADGGDGNDSIIGLTTDTTDGSDWAMGGHATLLGGDGNDYINPFYSNNATIDGGTGNDTIVMMGADSTITGSTGNDRISLGSADSVNVLINYTAGDGNDVIYNFTENDTLSIAGGTFSSAVRGSNVVVTVGSGKITLSGAATLDNLNIFDELSTGEVIVNTVNNTLVTGTANNDTITNTGNRATIDALAGNDLVTSDASNVMLDAGEGSDTIYASGAKSTVDGGDGSNFVNVTDSQGLYVVFNGQTTVDGFNTGFGDGSDTLYIPAAPAGVDFRSGILTFYDDSNAVVLSDETTTAKVNLYHESRHMLNKGVFIADNDWYSVESSDLTVKSGEEVYFVGPSATKNHGVDFSGISSNLNLTLDTAYIDSEDYVPGTKTWINGVYSIRGGAGLTTITGSDKADTIFTGTGNTTVNARGGNDYIDLTSAASRVNYTAGDGNDVITGFTANDTVSIGGAKYYSVASGNDLILTVGNGHMTLRGAATLDNINIIGSYDEAADSIISNSTNAASVVGTSGDDTIINSGSRATIDALAGNDSITSNGTSVLIYGGTGNDTVLASGANSTIDGGTGSNYVSVTGSQGLVVALNGQTTVNGFNMGFGSGADTVYITGDPAVNYRSGGLTLYEENRNGESLTFAGVTDTAKIYLHYASTNWTRKEIFIPDNVWYTVEESDFSAGSNSALYFVGATAGPNHGVDFSNISRSLNVTLNTDYSAEPQFWVNNVHMIVGGAGATTITGSDTSDTIVAGTGRTTIDAGAGNDNILLNTSSARLDYVSGDGNDLITGFNANSTLNISGATYSSVVNGDNVILTVGSGRLTLEGAADLSDLNINGTLTGGDTGDEGEIYEGGNATVDNYAGEPIFFLADYRGSLFDGNNFVVYSSDGALTLGNVVDKVIDLRDVNGNETLKAYTASTAGVIDGRGLAGYEIISGAANGTDIIYSGDDGSMLWGGAGTFADALLGGEGVDTFITGQHQGADNIFSAGVEDIVNLNDASLSDIVATAEVEGNKILVGFRSGNVIAVNSEDNLSATFKLADGTSHTYDHTSKTWQSA